MPFYFRVFATGKLEMTSVQHKLHTSNTLNLKIVKNRGKSLNWSCFMM